MKKIFNFALQLWNKYREIWMYLIFGVLTTLVNYVSYFICTRALGLSVAAANLIAWLLSVLFAYFTNRRWVFCSKATGISMLREALSFAGARIFSGVLDTAIMVIFVDVLGFNDFVIKLLSNVIVMITNYILSKLLIFAKRKED